MKIAFVGLFNPNKIEGVMHQIIDLKEGLPDNIEVVLRNELPTPAFLQEESIDLVHIHSSGFYEAASYKNTSIPTIYTLHSDIQPSLGVLCRERRDVKPLRNQQNESWTFQRIMKHAMTLASQCVPLFVKRYFLRRMDVVVMPSEWLAEKVGIENALIIHDGIDIEKFKPRETRRFQNKISVAFFGHPNAAKGIREAIDVFSQLDSAHFQKLLYPSRVNDSIREYVKARDDTIDLRGRCEDIVEAYNDSDIVLLPFRVPKAAIITPLVLIEAMACERAVITTNLPHLQEICGDSVVYVDSFDTQQMVAAVKRLAENPELRKELGKKARKRIVEGYNHEKMCREYAQLYESVADEKA